MSPGSDGAGIVEPTAGWMPDGSMSPDARRYSTYSDAMRGLIARRRSESRLTPNDIAAVILREQRELGGMFAPGLLEVWIRCHEWAAWELLDWTAETFPHTGIAAVMTIRCGYPSGEFWGGRCAPRAWIRTWVRKGFRRPESAWFNEDLVGRFGPPNRAPELVAIAQRVAARVREEDAAHAGGEQLELGSDAP